MSNASRPLRAALDHEPPEVIQRALILHWAATHQIPVARLAQSTAIAQLLDGGDQASIPPSLTTTLQREFPTCTLKQVEQIFEHLTGRAQRQSHGTVYTPEPIIEELVQRTLQLGWQTRTRVPTLCDPACGAGGFLIHAADILHRQHNFALPQIFAEGVVGIDVDPVALARARVMLDLYLLQNDVRPDTVQVNLVQADTLLTPLPDLLRIASVPDGFDVVVTNPPYVKLQNLDIAYREALLAEYADFAQGSFSLALLFLVRCHALLAAQGCAGLITQNNLFTSLAGRSVREYLQRTGALRRIVDFGHYKVFANASAYTCLLFMGRTPSAEFAYGRVAEGATSPAVLRSLPTAPVRVEDLDAKKWRLAAPHHLDNLRRIENTGVPLGEVTAIRVGFATLKDAVFVIPADTAASEHLCVTVGGVTYAVERALTRPARRVPDVRAGDDHTGAMRVIFPYEKVGRRYALLAEDVLAARYPEAYRYLLAHRAVLLERDKRRKTYAGWYAWGRTQGMDARGPKLLTKTFSKRPDFVLDASDALYYNGYGLFPRASYTAQSLPLAVLARVLNSRIMHYYAKLTSFQIDGDYQCYQKNFIERFGVPTFAAAEIQEIMVLADTDFEAWLAVRYGLDEAALVEVVGAM